MNLTQLIETFRKKFEEEDFSWHQDLLAVQFTITGEDGGVFYVEIKDGKLSIEPYEYNDRQALVLMSLKTLQDLLNKKIDATASYLTGKIKAEGDLGKVLEITKYI